MTLGQAQSIIYSALFADLTADAADRCVCITAWLDLHKVPYHIVQIKDKKHIVITYAAPAYNRHFKMKTLIAHYDRAENTPGANDNTAACVQLLFFSLQLLQSVKTHNIRIILTDGEEAGINGISQQGAYNLGRALRALHMQHDDIFVFDVCGSGDTLILSESGIWGRSTDSSLPLTAFHKRCCAYAAAVCNGHWYSLLTAYSDNAGFISAGLQAQVITVLPKHEAKILLRALREEKDTTALQNLQNCIIKNERVAESSPFATIIPKTWQRMHSQADSIATLTPEAFVLMNQWLQFIASVQEPILI
ncbi:MAG: M28 family peptidase [Treponema sp.]